MAPIRLSIRSRIYGGMGVLVLLGLALAGRGVWELTAIDDRVARMSALSDSTVRDLRLARLMEAMRGASLALKFSDTQSRLDAEDAAEARQMIGTLRAASKASQSEQQRHAYQTMLDGCASCHRLTGDLAGLGRQVDEHRGNLFGGGDRMTGDASKLVAAAVRSGNGDVAAAARDVQAALLLAQISNWRFLATRDPQGVVSFKTNADAAMAGLARLEQLQPPEEVGQQIAPLRATVTGYQEDFDSATEALRKGSAQFDGEMQPLIRQQMAASLEAAASGGRDFAGTKNATSGMITGTVAMQKLVAGLALSLGALIAYFVGRSIVRPVAGMTAAMASLAAGETAVAIPSRDATDEMGAMAKAVEVFRQNAIERVRLEAAQKTQAKQAAQEKHAALIAMADKVETETGAALESVGVRTAAMVKTTQQMSASASRTGASAESAAGAATQALANAQTVASAAEQLAASIREIGSQVSQSTIVVGRAVTAGKETRGTIERLNEQVERIGVVADMISEIAAKTNLLALNATIEAARAGDAGKGFAVVASEVKQLATQTARSTAEISRHIGEVRAATNASVAAVSRIEQTIDEVNAIAGSIAAAVEEQGAATAEIARNVSETAAAANEMSRRINEVSTEAERTGRDTAQVREDTTALHTEVGELRRSVVRVVRAAIG